MHEDRDDDYRRDRPDRPGLRAHEGRYGETNESADLNRERE
jgi:hypothetical protein